LYQFGDLTAAGGGTAALRLGTATLPARPFGARQSASGLVVDLGHAIGSAAWWRGLGTCLSLCIAAYLLAPSFKPMLGASPAMLGEAQHEEVRALSIAPLALGADAGRRMASTDAVVPINDAPERPSIDLVATLGEGDGLARMLERAGVAAAEAAEIASAVNALTPVAAIPPGTAMELRLGRRPDLHRPRPLESLEFRARFDLRLSLKRIDGKITIAQLPINVDATPLRIQGVAGDSLYRAARAAGAPPKAVEAFIRAVAAHLDIAEIGPGDRFDMVLQHRRAATGESEAGQLLYAGIELASGRSLQLMQWTQGGQAQWFEASGVGKAQGLLQRPVAGAVTSSFGMRRHPILGFSRMHAGIDFAAGYGTPIVAASDGQVISAGWAGGYGKQVQLAHGGGITTSYSHMSRILAEPGTIVRQGELIGYVGSTGLSTGPHLHYEMRRNGAAIDPASVQFVTRARLDGPELEAFRARLRSFLSLPVGAAAHPAQNRT